MMTLAAEARAYLPESGRCACIWRNAAQFCPYYRIDRLYRPDRLKCHTIPLEAGLLPFYAWIWV